MKTPLLLLATASVFAGCASGQLAAERTRADLLALERDSLRHAVAVEKVRVEAYADSIRFYDSIDSGEYERTLRTLRNRIEQLEFRQAGAGGGAKVATLRADDLFEPASATLSPAETGRST